MVAEQQGTDVESQQREAQTVVSIRGIIPVAQLGEAMGERMPALAGYLQRRGVRAAGSPFVRYHTFGETETDFELGVPVAGPVVAEGQIAVGELPGGPAIATWHIGPHNTLGDAYGRVAAWLKEHGREAAGPSWEVYSWIDLNQPGDPSSGNDPATWRTRLVQPIAAS